MSDQDEVRRQTDAEIERVRARSDAAAQGLSGDEEAKARVRASLEHAIKDLTRDIPRLERALGVEIEPGSFLLAGQVFGALVVGDDLVALMEKLPWVKDIFREFVERVREEASQ